MMQIYKVGGCVRDVLLGRAPKDIDYVVIGSTPDDMVKKGYTPVGRDFPIFMDSRGNEYALARSAKGTFTEHNGKLVQTSPSVTLEEDLSRRDLTINAMAADEDGNIIDPFGGQKDLRDGWLRHVGPSFADDPIRILRIARFAARYPGFEVHPDTMVYLKELVNQGSLDSLISERVWQELSRGLMETLPSRMFLVLRECGALSLLLPEIDRLFGIPQPPQHHPEIDTGVHVMMVLDYAARQGYSLEVRYAALMHDLGKGTSPEAEWPKHHGHEKRSADMVQEVSRRLGVPTACNWFASKVADLHGKVGRAAELRASTIVEMLYELDAFRRPQLFPEFLQACESDSRGRLNLENLALPELEVLKAAHAAASSIDGGAIARQRENPSPEQIKRDIYNHRISAVKGVIGNVADAPLRKDFMENLNIVELPLAPDHEARFRDILKRSGVSIGAAKSRITSELPTCR